MRFSPTARLHVVSKEEKEARLKAFITEHLAGARASGANAPLTYRLLALSAESPAASALQALAPEIASQGVAIQVVLARRTPAKPFEPAECRYVTDVRLLDAHEQLVLDSMNVWIGDCMRRDPLKRDTYELFSHACAAAALRAERSFAHIWGAAGPAGSLTASRRSAPVSAPPLFDPSLIAGADAIQALAVLRH